MSHDIVSAAQAYSAHQLQHFLIEDTSYSKALHALDTALHHLDTATQIQLYAAVNNLMNNLAQNPQQSAIALEIFTIQAQGILKLQHSPLNTVLKSVVIGALALVGFALVGTLGLGIGLLAGTWATPLAFLGLLAALKLPAWGVVIASSVSALITSTTTSYTFFKKAPIEIALDECIRSFKVHYGMTPLNFKKEAQETQTVNKIQCGAS